MKKNRAIIISAVIVIVIVLVLIFTLGNNDQQKGLQNQTTEKTDNFDLDNAHEKSWAKTTLTNVQNNKKFSISQYKDKKPVLLESFAVWCPTCTKQQNEIKKLHEEIGSKVESISLNTDPSEDAQKVKSHAENNRFTWKYSIAPSNMTNKLIEDFTQNFVNAPQSPIALICPDGRAKLLERGVKTSSELKEKINKC